MPPRIPLYNDTQVRPEAVSGATVQAPRNDLAQVGNDLAAAGGDLGQIAKREQELRDADRLFRTEAQMQDDYLKYETSLQSRRGQNAWGITSDVETWFNDNGKKYSEGLESDRQRALFTPKLQGLKTQSLGRAATYEQNERHKSLEESAAASIQSSTNLAAAAWDDPQAIDSAKKDIIQRIGVQAGFNGWTPERRAAEESAHLTNLHKQVLQTMADKDPDQATKYFAANKGEIAGADQEEIGAVVEAGGLRVKSQQASDSLLAQGKSETETLAAARQQYGGKMRDEVTARVKQGFADQHAAAAADERKTADVAWDYFGRFGSTDSIPIAVLEQLDGRTLDAMKTKERSDKISTNWTTYSTLFDQAKNDLTTFKKVDLRGYQSELAPAQLKQLIELQKTPVLSPDIATLSQQFTTAHGLLNLKKPEARAQFDSAAQTALADAQAVKGDKKLTYDERQGVIDKMMMQGEVTGGGLFGLYSPNRRFYEVAGSGDREDFVPFVPDTERPKIEKALKDAGIEASDANVTEVYRRKQGL